MKRHQYLVSIVLTILIGLIGVSLLSQIFAARTASAQARENGQLPTEITGRDGTRMVLIPAGNFVMGSDKGRRDERPSHSVYLGNFYMDRHEVTNSMYRKFLEANPDWRKDRIESKYHDGRYLRDWNGNSYPEEESNHPVTWVSWYAALAYAEWAGKRLPTEKEWEKAARGGLAGKDYPWGDDISHSNANYSGVDGRDQWEKTSPVQSFPPNGYGLYDMAGNVAEWCLDIYDRSAYERKSQRNPETIIPLDPLERIVVRGGSWQGNPVYALNAPPKSLSVTYRDRYLPKNTLGSIGFRCISR